MKSLCTAIFVVLISLSSVNAADKGKHLFILSGQSNMKYMDPNIAFIPAVEKAFGKENVVVMDASPTSLFCYPRSAIGVMCQFRLHPFGESPFYNTAAIDILL